MSFILSTIKVAFIKLFDSDFLIAMLPVVFYGLGFVFYAGEASHYFYMRYCSSDGDRGFNFYNMMNSINLLGFMLACNYCIYFVLKGRRIASEFVSFRDKYIYMQILQFIIALPCMFILSVLISFFFIPGES